MSVQSFMNKLRKMLISNINKHHKKTINFCFHSWWYDEDIIMWLYYFTTSLCVMFWTNFFNKNVLSYLCISVVYTKLTFQTEINIFLQNLNNLTLKTQNVIISRMQHSDSTTLSCATQRLTLKRENSTNKHILFFINKPHNWARYCLLWAMFWLLFAP